MTQNSSDPSEKDLVHAARKDPEAFAAIVARYDERLRRYIVRLGLLDADAVKDVLQEAFIKTYIHLNDYDSSLPLSAWLYRIARNETMSHFRKQRNRPHSVEYSEDTEQFEKIADELDIEHEANASIDQAAVRAALNTLDLKYREILILRYFEEKSYEDIAAILLIPMGTVGVYLNRGKKLLKIALKRYDTQN
ncbi:MAG: subfamily polymerase sigma factor [Parcubacteria group bacterium]|nr:subfamily polymerase sigma factor [Parcubacteria group bacterium]